MSDLNRRQFVSVVAAAAAGCALCEFCNVAEAADAPAASGKPIDVGPIDQFAKESISDKFAKSDKFFIINHEGKIYAASSTCTHKRSQLKVKGDEMVCPAHGSHFAIMGNPTKGPAKSSLYRYAISKSDAGHVLVDKSKQFEEKNWDDPAASIKAE